MLLARSDDDARFSAARPLALFLTEGHEISPSAFQLLKISAQIGFSTVAVPWFSIKTTPKAIFATAGIILHKNTKLPITDWFYLRPRFILPLFNVDDITAAPLAQLAERCPNAILAFHPGLRVSNFFGSRVRSVPALVQAHPQLVRVYMDDEAARPYLRALLRGWWKQRLQEGRASSAILSRLVLFANLHVRNSRHCNELQLLHVDLQACGGFASELLRPFWFERARNCLRLAYDRVHIPPAVLLPTPSVYSLDYAGSTAISGDSNHLFFPESWFAREEGRMRLRSELNSVLSEGETRRVSFGKQSPGYHGISIRARKHDHHIIFDFEFGQGTMPAQLSHPLAALLPNLNAGHCYVETSARKDSRVVFLNPRLVGPKLREDRADNDRMLLKYVSRTVNQNNVPSSDRLGRRYVEPGVGRGYLIDFLRVDGQPELYDFSVIGGGITQYSRGGYVNVGRPIDGRISIGRALHRKQCAERLAKIGCRVAPVVAIFALEDDYIELPDDEYVTAALVVRGFRSVSRVKQLDPVACLYHSRQARPSVVSFLKDTRWTLRERQMSTPLQFDEEPDTLWWARKRTGMVQLGPLSHLLTPYGPNAWVKRLRLRASRLYAPLLLDVIKARVAVEIGRDPLHEPLSNFEYAQWFASTMGRQLALFRRARFLHDYHQDGISDRHQLPRWLYTLGENNVSLMAEFPDLDTGIFVDSRGGDSSDELRLMRRDRVMLATNFKRFHMRDVRCATEIVSALVMVACCGQPVAMKKALACFESEYAKIRVRPHRIVFGDKL